MLDKNVLGIVSIILTLVGYTPYFLTTLKGQTKPHLFSWIIWGLISAISYFAQDSDNAGPGAWASGVSATGCFVIAALAVRYGEKNIKRSDWFCLIATLAAIPLWAVTENALWAVLLITVIDAGGYYPTFRKSWSNPREENIIVYILDTIKYVFALFALSHYSVITTLSPLFIVLAEGSLVLLILWRRRTVP